MKGKPQKVFTKFRPPSCTESHDETTSYQIFMSIFPYCKISRSQFMHHKSLKGGEYKSFCRFFKSIIERLQGKQLKLNCCPCLDPEHVKFIDQIQSQMHGSFGLKHHNLLFQSGNNNFCNLNRQIMCQVISKPELMKEYFDRKNMIQQNKTSHYVFLYEFKVGKTESTQRQEQNGCILQPLKDNPSFEISD